MQWIRTLNSCSMTGKANGLIPMLACLQPEPLQQGSVPAILWALLLPVSCSHMHSCTLLHKSVSYCQPTAHRTCSLRAFIPFVGCSQQVCQANSYHLVASIAAVQGLCAQVLDQQAMLPTLPSKGLPQGPGLVRT